MKQIFPLTGFWNNNGFASAKYMKMYLGIDNLENEAIFYYQFLAPDETILATGNLILDGEAYQNWDGSNAAAWDFAKSKLGVIFEETK